MVYLFSNVFDTMPCLVNISVSSQNHAHCKIKELCVEQANLRNIWSLGNVLEVFFLYFLCVVQVCDSEIFSTKFFEGFSIYLQFISSSGHI